MPRDGPALRNEAATPALRRRQGFCRSGRRRPAHVRISRQRTGWWKQVEEHCGCASPTVSFFTRSETGEFIRPVHEPLQRRYRYPAGQFHPPQGRAVTTRPWRVVRQHEAVFPRPYARNLHLDWADDNGICAEEVRLSSSPSFPSRRWNTLTFSRDARSPWGGAAHPTAASAAEHLLRTRRAEMGPSPAT